MLKILFNTILGLVLIYIWSRFVNLEEIFATISKVDIKSLAIAFVLMLLSPVVRALRLQIFLSEIKKVDLKDLIFLNGVSLILNFFIPIRAGEIAKGVYLNTKYDLPLGKSVIWIFIDRFVDFLAVLLLTAILLMLIPTNLPAGFALTLSIIFTTALIITYLAVFQIELSKKLANIVQHLLIQRHLKAYFEKFSHFVLESFSILDRHPKDLFLMTLITFAAYGVDAGIWYFVFVSLGVYEDFFRMYLGQILSALIYLIPAAPGYIGSAEASGLLILSGVLGIAPNLASAMTVLFHISSAVFVIIFGLISIFSLKIDLGLVLRKALKRD